MGGAIGLALAGIIFLFVLFPSNNATLPPSSPPPASDPANQPNTRQTQIAQIEASGTALPGVPVPEEAATHVDEGASITYNSSPPSSGQHYPSWSDYLFSETQIPDGKLVHNLEHGGVVLYYRPDLPDDAKQTLRSLLTTLPPGKYGEVKLIVSPHPRLEAAVQVTAWGRALQLPSVDVAQITSFYTAWVDKGLEDVP